MSVAEVKLWGRAIGAVSWDASRNVANFEYSPEFIASGIEVSPLMMPLMNRIYSFPELARTEFHGLPGLVADSLPDTFGNALVNAWLAKEGRAPESFNPVERLCYTGNRGMGALEYAPAHAPFRSGSSLLQIDALVELAGEILSRRSTMQGSFATPDRERSLLDILRVGTSAGGARAKAIIAWNPQTDEIRSGQVDCGAGFSYWLLKFDGVSGNADRDLQTPRGYGLIEYAYHKMALAAGIEMSECRMLRENGRNHFMTRRFDRTESGRKLHMQSLAALGHFDYNQAGAYSYEQAVQVMRGLKLPMRSIEEQFRRTAFNVLARNQDDHVKNIAFLMDRSGSWGLAPAFDLMFNYQPDGMWTNRHQMSMNAKRDGFTLTDFVAFGDTIGLRKGRAQQLLEQVRTAVRQWPQFAQEAGVSEPAMQRIGGLHRIDLSGSD